jgi:protoporphyrinogen oxidase
MWAAAALLAKCDKKVLVIERHDRPGGYAHSFYRNRYHFDAAIHVTAGCGQRDDDNITTANNLRIDDVIAGSKSKMPPGQYQFRWIAIKDHRMVCSVLLKKYSQRFTKAMWANKASELS